MEVKNASLFGWKQFRYLIEQLNLFTPIQRIIWRDYLLIESVSNNMKNALWVLLLVTWNIFFSGCHYQAGNLDPEKLATMDTELFPTMPVSKHVTYVKEREELVMFSVDSTLLYGASPYYIKPTGLMGSTVKRPPGPKGAQWLELDEGTHTIVGAYVLELKEAGMEQLSASYVSPFALTVDCSGGDDYKITGKMVSSDLSGGVELWIENVSTGAIVSGPERFEMDYSR